MTTKTKPSSKPGKVLRRIMNLFLFFIATVLVMGGGAAVWLARDRAHALVHPGRSHPDRTPSNAGIDDWESFLFDTSDGLRLNGWFVPPPASGDGATIIYVHGIGGNRAQLNETVAWLYDHGYGAVMFDLRNHGDSDGNVTTMGYLEALDVRGAVDYALTRSEVNPEKIGLFGVSLGGAAALMAAPQIPEARAIIVESTFSGITENVAEGIERFTGLPSFPFAPMVIWFGEQEAGVRIGEVSPADAIASVTDTPLLVLHGTNDHLFSDWNADRIYEAANEPKELYIYDGGGHGNLRWFDRESYDQQVLTFLATHLPSPVNGVN